jgi:oxygen-independent coproporphyrinogen-3 oxidase
MKTMVPMYEAIRKEIAMRGDYLQGETVETIYFGGGTPSLLSATQLGGILDAIGREFSLSTNPEITLEANPDDLNNKSLSALKSAGVNRLSIGIQSFDDERLKLLNRSHSASEALNCVNTARSVGFENITIDLIYAIPPEDIAYWQQDLNTALELDIPHISLYGLTIEEKTVLGKWKAKGKFSETPEDTAAEQYRLAIERLSQNGYEQYEVSNFAKQGFRSKHNSAYWSGAKYLGIGPGAHSFDGNTRSYNVRSNPSYIRALENDEIPETVEILTETQRKNEYILTRLRTAEGLDLNQFSARFEDDLLNANEKQITKYENQGLLKIHDGHISLTTDGFMVADEIALGLFYDE